MYLGDRWECLFTRGGASVRAYSRFRLDAGSYWLQMPADKLWVF
jgi:iron(III) transport system ATP-binding protein